MTALPAISPEPSTRPAPPGIQAPVALTVAGHELTVFAEWPPLLEAILRDIAGARKRVWLETYIFADDAGGKAVAQALMERARAGVEVRVQYDAVGSALTPAAFFAQLASAGVQLHAYHTLLEGLKRFRPFTILNRRNHRKLLIVDDTAGYFGGMNIIDNIPAPHAKHALTSSAGWRDVHLRLSGPKQAELAESFERSWSRATGRRKARRAHPTRAALKAQLGQMTDDPLEGIHFFDSGPRGRLSRAARVYALLIRHARRQISFSMAYFIPIGMVLRALLQARKRRVGVFVVIPGKSDVPIVKYATAYLYDLLIRRGFRIYERRQRMLHAKMMVVDGLYTVAGSANLDPRSLYTNLEFVAVIRSQALVRVMQRLVSFEQSQSQRITLRACRQVSWWRRQLHRAAWLLRWWL